MKHAVVVTLLLLAPVVVFAQQQQPSAEDYQAALFAANTQRDQALAREANLLSQLKRLSDELQKKQEAAKK